MNNLETDEPKQGIALTPVKPKKKWANEKRNVLIKFRVSHRTWRWVKSVAEKMNISMSDYIRKKIGIPEDE